MAISLLSLQCQSRQGKHFKQTILNESLKEISNENGVIVANFAKCIKLRVKGHCSHILTFTNFLGSLLMENSQSY
jgi:hypothetical protein